LNSDILKEKTEKPTFLSFIWKQHRYHHLIGPINLLFSKKFGMVKLFFSYLGMAKDDLFG
jgi:demethoxyubiquinone hydroxylase (CLK1/Coq7/Cat5 family)